jgi:hypothetical protein
MMVHEQELVPPEPAPADPGRVDERWPVPYAILFITMVSLALWAAIIVTADWLIG